MRSTQSLFWLGLATTVAFWPGIINAGTVPRWSVLAIGVPICLMLMGTRPDTRSWWPALILMCAAATLAWTPDILGGVDSLIHIAILMGVFWLGAHARSIDNAWRGLQWGVALMMPIVVLQLFNLIDIPQAVAPAGLLMNKNMMGEAALIAAVSAMMMSSWALFICALIIVVLTTSKAVIGAFLMVLAILLYRRSPISSGILGLCLMTVCIMAFTGGMPSAVQRWDMWVETVKNLTPFGHGLGSFSTTYSDAFYAHSEVLHIAYEMGIFALPILAAFVYALGVPHAHTERIVLVAVVAVSFFSFPLHMPVTGFSAALAAGYLAGCRHRLRTFDCSRGGALGVRA